MEVIKNHDFNQCGTKGTKKLDAQNSNKNKRIDDISRKHLDDYKAEFKNC